jgi:hypothetical protein
MYAWRNTKARSRNHCSRAITITITYSDCVLVVLCVYVSITTTACAQQLSTDLHFPNQFAVQN